MIFTRKTLMHLVAAIAVTVLLTQTVLAQNAPERKKRIAILDFDYATVQSDVESMFGADEDIGKGITNLLVNNLVNDGTYTVVERQAIDKIINEQNFSTSGRTDPSSAAKIGKLLNVDAVIMGSITQFGNDNKHIGGGGNGGNWHGYGMGGIGLKKSKAIVELSARLVDVNTGEILAVAQGKGESARSGLSLSGGGGNWGGAGGGNLDMGSSNFENTIIGEAVKAAVNQMTQSIVEGNVKIPLETRVVNVNGLVAAVSGGVIVLNVGTNAGVHVGDTLTVQRVTQVIKDPVTGQVIRRLTTPVGTVSVTSADNLSSLASPLSGSDFQTNDEVTETSQK